jgi:hypothetical protein
MALAALGVAPLRAEVPTPARLTAAPTTAAPTSAADSAAPALAGAIEIGEVPVCTEALPAAVALPGDAATLPVRLLVLLDGVTEARGTAVLARAQAAYAPLALTLRATYRAVSFSTSDGAAMIAAAKAAVGGARPDGTDAVVVLTAKDLTDAGDPSLAGLADCIGGVAHPTRAFAVAETTNGAEDIVLGSDSSAKVAAHELGHLLGGQHHLANCAEGVAESDLDGDLVSPCTVMFNVVNPTSLGFSVANAAVVRGHAEAYLPG